MKFAITGHTSGIGKAIAELCHVKGYQWIGFSRRTGYDIVEDCDKIVNESSDCDVFINNAYYDYVQIDLLYKMWDIWKDQRKQIVCISSLVGDRRHSGDAYPYCPYIVHKAALDNACEILCNTVSECAVIGTLDSERGQVVTAYIVPKEKPKDKTEYIEELQSFVRNRLAPYKYPRKIKILTNLPRNESGKLQRFRLKE